MNMSVPVYIHRDSDMVLTAAPEAAVMHCFGSLAGLSMMFGGWVRYGRVDDDTRFYGVYGSRNATRFRRLLVESGLALQYLHRPPPERMICREVNGSRPNRLERLSLEFQLQRRWKAQRSA